MPTKNLNDFRDAIYDELLDCSLDCWMNDILERVAEQLQFTPTREQTKAAWLRGLTRAYGELLANLYETPDRDQAWRDELTKLFKSDFNRLMAQTNAFDA